jgi:hypothetical protein
MTTRTPAKAVRDLMAAAPARFTNDADRLAYGLASGICDVFPNTSTKVLNDLLRCLQRAGGM